MRDPKDLTILVVEDENDLRQAIVFTLQRKGFQVKEASNGKEAFEIVTQSRIDVVLTDVKMPGGNGIELLDKIKALNPTTPIVIMVTGFSDISNEEAYAKGANAIFSKPFDRKELIATVLKLTAPNH